jgi:hypothetical protein
MLTHSQKNNNPKIVMLSNIQYNGVKRALAKPIKDDVNSPASSMSTYSHSTIYLKYLRVKSWLIAIVCLFIMVGFSTSSKAQEKPPKPVALYLYNLKNLEFGAFALKPTGAGGSVIVSYGGSRSYLGDVILLNLGHSYSPAYFEVEGNPGTLVQFANPPAQGFQLTGSNGGTMWVHFNFSVDSSLGNSFIITTIPPVRTIFQIGGSLAIENIVANKPGYYSGNFTITLIQQ